VFARTGIGEERAKSWNGADTGSVLRVGRAGASRVEWVQEAILELKDQEGVDRVGVWLEEQLSADGVVAGPVIFRGEVWERGIGTGMPEWSRLSSESPLPMKSLGNGKSCEYEVERPNSGPILGPLLELQRVLWVPVLERRILRGVVMLGTQKRQKALPRTRAENVAEELGLLLELQEERRLAATRKADLELLKRMWGQVPGEQNPSMILERLAESCMGGGSPGGAGAVFALIGERRGGLPVAATSSASPEEQLVVRAQSGDSAWADCVNHGPLETLWRQAIEKRHVVGDEAGHLPLAKDISRILAIPLECRAQIFGVLLVGLPRQRATLDELGRLELRAMLAARILEQEHRADAPKRTLQSSMVQAEKLAALDQRVTGIVHELGNPLTTILANAQRLVLRGAAGANSAEARQILEEAERATGIVRQLLYLARDTRPEMRLMSLNELVERTAELQKPLLEGSRLHLEVEILRGLPPVKGDFGQLQQVLLNLLQNAHQAMEESGMGTTMGIRTAIGGTGYVTMEVWDDGPGIPEALQERIFDPFFTTKPAGKGTGLGLAIVNGFVRQHEGTVSVRSSPAEGARFVVELPAAKQVWEAAEPEKRKQARPPKMLPASFHGKGKTATATMEQPPHILVVEDEPTVSSLIADVLREEGMRVDVLSDGQRALERVRKESYDLAICDLRMPGMDGQIFYGALVQSQSPLREHVLFVTGDVLAQRTQEFLEGNHLPHVAKPFRVEELSLAVRGALWGKRKAASS